ncbi:Neurotrypsin [Holothuria leucospilota]|uniref:Neurotrypsin n=1 Tax=Holothuria leucospilota TaxID=206669 RepID=A0A9Q1C0K8_HOLLE|nr:Neurotrypsin [Holothuria leucospilota]
MDEVSCVGDEERLDQCSFRGWFLHDCVHQEDAGVRCSTEDGGLRLVGGNSLYEGRVEVFSRGEWGTICDDSWDDNDASVVCRALGFTNPATAFDGAFYGEGTGEILLSNIDCDGTERRLEECNQKSGFVNNCEHSEDAGVRCTPKGKYSML